MRASLTLGRLAALAAIAWYVLLTIAYLWPVLVALDSAVPHDIRDPGFQATVLRNVSDHLLKLDVAHLYDGSFFYPVANTLALSDAQIGLQPIALPLRVLTNDALLTLNLLVVLTFPVTAACAHLLTKLITGSRLAAIVGGTVYAFAAYRFTHIVHLNLLSSWTIPLAFYFLELVLRNGSRGARSGWAVSLVLAASMALHYFLFLVLLEPVYVAVRLFFTEDRRAMIRRLLSLVVPGLIAAIAIGLLLIPYVLLASEDYRRSLSETFQFSARFRDYLVPAADSTVMQPVYQALHGLSGPDERQLSPGFIALGLALAGIAWAAIRRRRGWLVAAAPWLLTGLAAFVLSLGPRLWPDAPQRPPSGFFLPLPYTVLAKVLPVFSSLRSPARFGVVVLLAIAVLAAMTVAAVLRSAPLRAAVARARPGTASLRAVQGGLVALVVAAMAAEYAVAPAMETVPWGRDVPAVYRWLETAPSGPVVEVPPNPDQASLAMLYATIDGHPRLNGWSGFTPTQSEPVNPPEDLEPRTVPGFLAAARRLGATYVLVHEAHVPGGLASTFARSAQIRATARLGPDVVYVFR